MTKYFKKTICSLIITSMIVMPLLGLTPKKAEAQTSLSGYITSLTPVIAKMPGCTKAIGSGITDLFNSVKKLFTGKSKVGIDNSSMDKLLQKYASENITVSDPLLQSKIDEVKASQAATQKATENQDKNQNCLNGIGKAIAKVLINRLTDSIINWIQTGDAGDPLYIQDQGAYFKDIAKNELLGLIGEINNPKLFPFGKAFIQAQTNSFNNKFANNATYSLNKMIQDENPNFSDQTFAQDFSQGGWGAWDALTQNPANNPLGFALMASNELAKRIENKTELAAGALQQSGGFLGVERCIDPKGVTKQEDDAGRKERASDPQYDPTNDSMFYYDNRICKTWQTVTPGKLIGDQLVNAVQKKDNALLDVQTLNDAMAAILDAVLAKFSSSLQSESGLAGVTTGDPYAINPGVSGIGNSQTGSDYSDAQINESSWLGQHPDFNIRTDLNQALIDEQRIYQDKLKEQNKQLFESNEDATKPLINNNGLIPTIYQLDYCIPGPHPNWEEEAQQAVADIQNAEGSINFTSMTDGGIFKLLDSLSLGMLGTVTNLVNSYAFKCGNDAGKAAANTYMNQFNTMTTGGNEYWINKDSGANSAFCTVQGFILATDRAESEYEKVIKNIYSPKYLPSSAPEAKTEFGKIDNYTQIMNDNLKTIDTLTGIITRLNDVKSKIDTLNSQFADPKNPISQDDYEAGILPWKNAFARISASLYSGDDIAAADSLTKQIVDEKDYVYNNLLKSATGCEEEVVNNVPSAIKWQVYESVRPDYPKPHLYDYPDRLSPKFSIPYTTPTVTDKTFTPATVFWNRWSGVACDPTATGAWELACFDLSGYLDTNDPHRASGGYWWEKNLKIW